MKNFFKNKSKYDKFMKNSLFKKFYSIEELKGNGTIAIRREDKNR